ncbi:MAG: hypothetical protein EBR51_00135 [Gammaproteobacteria bacterium]|nr:hypothetical protein [Gammaproteobacteria bacterium]
MWTLKAPTAHGAHCALPVVFLKVPASHARHPSNPTPKKPRRHTHCSTLEDPGSDVLLTLQSIQAVTSPSSSTACSLYDPAAQAWHSPVPVSNMPAPQMHA